jgi:hypothetical protein
MAEELKDDANEEILIEDVDQIDSSTVKQQPKF